MTIEDARNTAFGAGSALRLAVLAAGLLAAEQATAQVESADRAPAPPHPASSATKVTFGAYSVSKHLPFGFAGPRGYLLTPFLRVAHGDHLRVTVSSAHYTASNGELSALGVAAVALDLRYGFSLTDAVDVEIGYQAFTAPGFGIARSQAVVAGLRTEVRGTRLMTDLVYDFEVGSGLLLTVSAARSLAQLDLFASLGYNRGYYYDGSAPSHVLFGVGVPLHVVGGARVRPELTYTQPLGRDFAGGLALAASLSFTPGR